MNTTEEERDVSGYTRGVNIDAYAQEREMDRELADIDDVDDEEDVEVVRYDTGR